MKLLSKLIVMILSANLAFNVFAGGKMTKEATDNDEKALVQLTPAQEKRLADQVREEAAMRPVGAQAAVEQVAPRRDPLVKSLKQVELARIMLYGDKDSEAVKEAQRLYRALDTSVIEDADKIKVVLQGAVINLSLEDAVIQLSHKIIHSLKQQFDNKLLTPARWGARKLIAFDYAHIFNSFPGHAGHYDPNNEFTEGQKKASTVFPRYWQPNKIMAKIKEAYLNVGSWKYVKKSAIECKTSEGITIRIVFELKNGKSIGKVKTAYPIN